MNSKQYFLKGCMVKNMGNKTVYSRLLSPFETVYAMVGMTNFVRVSAHGSLDMEILKKSWITFVRENPVLLATLNYSSDGIELNVDPSKEVSPPKIREGSPEDKYSELVSIGHTVASLDVHSTGDKHIVRMIAHHCICDGKLVMYWFQRYWEIYSDFAMATNAAEREIRPVPDSPEKVLADQGWSKGPINSFYRMEGLTTRPFKDPVGLVPGVNPLVSNDCQIVLTKDETNDLILAAKSHGLTIHGVVSGAILIAERELLEGEDSMEIAVSSMVDARTHLSKIVEIDGCTNFLGYAVGRVEVGPDSDVCEVGREVTRQIQEDLEKQIIQQSALHIEDMLAQWSSDNQIEPISISNLGVIQAVSLPDDLELIEFEYHGLADFSSFDNSSEQETPRQTIGRNHAISTYLGELKVRTLYPSTVLSPERAQALVDRIKELLLSTIKK